MIPDALQAWLAMGGDARHVWPAWALALAVLVGCALHARRERRRVLDALRRQARRDDSRHGDSRCAESRCAESRCDRTGQHRDAHESA